MWILVFPLNLLGAEEIPTVPRRMGAHHAFFPVLFRT
jgi:hypothetical protein